MKYYIGVILMLFTLASAFPRDPAKAGVDKVTFTDECAEELNISVSKIVRKLKEHSTALPYDNVKGHCFVKCYYEKIGFFDKDHGFKMKYMYNLMNNNKSKHHPTGEILALLEKCNKDANHELNVCERAHRGFQCLIDKMDSF